MKIKISILILMLTITLQHVLAQPVSKNAEMLDKTLSSVVTVAVYDRTTTKKSLGFRGDADIAYQKVLDLSDSKGSGSGFVIQYAGKYYVVTNAHVVEQASDKAGALYVYSINQTKYEAKILGGDSFYDIAVLEFIDKPGSEISSVKFRKSEARVGEQVYAIGNPLGDYPYTVTDGIVSAKNRVRGGLTGKFGFIQTTATIIWGNSGGPLVDVNGDVLGVNSQIAFAKQGNQQIWQSQINFALEGTLSEKLVMDILTNNGLVKRAFVGVEISRMKMDESQKRNKGNFGFSAPEINEDPVLSGVLPESPAYSQLSRYVGYTVKSINNTSIRNTEEALGILEKVTPGQSIQFGLEMNGNKVNVTAATRTLNESTLSLIGQYVARKWGANITQQNNTVFLNIFDRNIYGSYQKNATEQIIYLDQNASKAPAEMLLNQEWRIIGAGIYEQNVQIIWKTTDLSDLGAALKLAGTVGAIDLVLFRKMGDPNDSRSYIRKRFVLSGEDSILKETVWY